MNKTLVFVFTIIFTSIVLLLFLYAGLKKDNNQKNGFTRQLLNHDLYKFRKVSTSPHLRNIIGVTSNHLYFSLPNPDKIICTDLGLSKFDTISLKIPLTGKLNLSFSSFVDSPLVYMISGNLPGIILYNLTTNQYKKIITAKFSKGIVYDTSSCLVKFIDSSSLNDLFRKIYLKTNLTKEEVNISERNGDAGFSMDGKILFDRFTKKSFYLSYFCNQITCFDTALNLLYKFKTIDTNNLSKTKILVTRQIVTKEKPPKRVNYSGAVFNGVLYVRSALKADNEKDDEFVNNSIIDMYKQDTGSYIGSFYIPLDDHKRIKDFKIVNSNTVLVLYTNSIVIYKFKQE